jgi:hypothetical protein
MVDEGSSMTRLPRSPDGSRFQKALLAGLGLLPFLGGCTDSYYVPGVVLTVAAYVDIATIPIRSAVGGFVLDIINGAI